MNVKTEYTQSTTDWIKLDESQLCGSIKAAEFFMTLTEEERMTPENRQKAFELAKAERDRVRKLKSDVGMNPIGTPRAFVPELDNQKRPIGPPKVDVTIPPTKEEILKYRYYSSLLRSLGMEPGPVPLEILTDLVIQTKALDYAQMTFAEFKKRLEQVE
jgi:hypothetical protein